MVTYYFPYILEHYVRDADGEWKKETFKYFNKVELAEWEKSNIDSRLNALKNGKVLRHTTASLGHKRIRYMYSPSDDEEKNKLWIDFTKLIDMFSVQDVHIVYETVEDMNYRMDELMYGWDIIDIETLKK